MSMLQAILKRLFIYITLILIIIITIFTTNIWANFIIKGILLFSKQNIQIESITGSIYSGLNFNNIEYILDNSTNIAQNKPSTSKIKLNTVNLNFHFNLYTLKYSVYINKISGSLIKNKKKYPIVGNIIIHKEKKKLIEIDTAHLSIGENTFIKNEKLTVIGIKDFAILGLNNGNIPKKTEIKVTIDGDLNKHQININANVNSKMFNYLINGKLIYTNNNYINYTSQLRFNKDNILSNNINFKIPRNYNLLKTEISGEIISNFEDLSLAYQYIPEIQKINGTIISNTKFSGYLNNLDIQTDTKIKNLSTYIPHTNTKIKTLNLSLITNPKNLTVINITGAAELSKNKGVIKISGNIDFKDYNNIKNNIYLTGENIHIIEDEHYDCYISPNLNLVLNNTLSKLDINGDIYIDQANINLTYPEHNTVVISNDVIIKDSDIRNKNPKFNINPHIHIKMKNDIHFKGYDFDANLTGDLLITKVHNNYYGNGKITIKKGTYTLPSKTFNIKRGRILYASGTLLSNPSLDIKLENQKSNINLNNKVENEKDTILYIHGTLTNPVIDDKGFMNDGEAALHIFQASGGQLINKLQQSLHLEELGIGANDNQTSSTDDSFLENKHFVIGKRLNDAIYLQYLKGILVPTNTVKLKYQLSKNWGIGLESGTDGNGVDLSFSIDTD